MYYHRPAGDSSDEDDELDHFSFNGEIKSEKQKFEEIAAKEYNERTELANTANNRLYTAIINRNLDEIRDEIKQGFDINSKVNADWTPIFLSTAQGNSDVVDELLKNGADPKVTKNGLTTLMSVCDCPRNITTSKNVLTIIRLLLENNVSVEAIDRKRRTAFMLACFQGFIEVVKYLLPLSKLEAQDNQGWTAIFYAVNSNNIEIVKFLIENGANVDHNDLRNNNIKYYASINDQQEILDVLPINYYEISPQDFANNIYNYETAFDSLLKDERPDFAHDISFLLYGMKCQNLIPKFNENKIDLLTFLVSNDAQLKKFDVEMSFQRTKILQGLFKFHKQAWGNQSIPLVTLGEMYTTYDLFVAIANAVKHLTILEASIKYLKQNLVLTETEIKKDRVTLNTILILRKINRIKKVCYLLRDKALFFDSTAEGPADLITKNKKLKRNSLNKKVIVGFVSITLFCISRYFILRIK